MLPDFSQKDNPESQPTTLGKNALACRVPPAFSFRNPDFHPGVADDLRFRDPRSGYLLQSEAEVNAAAIIQLYAIGVGLTRRQICCTDVENPLLGGRIPTKRSVRRGRTDRLVYVRG